MTDNFLIFAITTTFIFIFVIPITVWYITEQVKQCHTIEYYNSTRWTFNNPNFQENKDFCDNVGIRP